jgi:plasmid stabilization system protein ParE
MNYSFHPSARAELDEAVSYYEDCRAGLGLQFAKEVYSTVHRIMQFPEAWSHLSENTRRCLTNRFPYGIVYEILDDEVVIIAVMQLNRKPGYWQERLDSKPKE